MFSPGLYGFTVDADHKYFDKCFKCKISPLIEGFCWQYCMNSVGITSTSIHRAPNFRASNIIGKLAVQLFHDQVCVLPSLVNFTGQQIKCLELISSVSFTTCR